MAQTEKLGLQAVLEHRVSSCRWKHRGSTPPLESTEHQTRVQANTERANTPPGAMSRSLIDGLTGADLFLRGGLASTQNKKAGRHVSFSPVVDTEPPAAAQQQQQQREDHRPPRDETPEAEPLPVGQFLRLRGLAPAPGTNATAAHARDSPSRRHYGGGIEGARSGMSIRERLQERSRADGLVRDRRAAAPVAGAPAPDDLDEVRVAQRPVWKPPGAGRFKVEYVAWRRAPRQGQGAGQGDDGLVSIGVEDMQDVTVEEIREVKPDPGREARLEPGWEIKPEPGVEIKPDPGVQVKPKPGTRVKPEPGVEAKPEPGVRIKPETGVEIKAEPRGAVEADPRGMVKPETKGEDNFRGNGGRSSEAWKDLPLWPGVQASPLTDRDDSQGLPGHTPPRTSPDVAPVDATAPAAPTANSDNLIFYPSSSSSEGSESDDQWRTRNMPGRSEKKKRPAPAWWIKAEA
ncbi:hypothetical protein NKR23_g7097 [Pleurostoma richardsiae]|uniref:Uncharacterized protein n=1 Tax=Pleurostoma richardsiae TaxID=41990 RepID=A0AA38RNZ2_9PEZI|nr:hypothetical protein NKR23_g7097 [Pleurostoma richardsiae]